MNKINLFINNHFIKIIIIFAIFQPIVDMCTSIMLKMNFNITIGILVKILFLIYLLYCYFFVYKIKNKKNLIYFVLIFFYLVLYYFFNDFYSIKETIKVLFFPIVLLLLCNIITKEKNEFDYKILIIVSMIYSILIIIPFLFNFGFNSYDVAKKGCLGLFNSANEIGAIMSIIFPLLFQQLYNKFKIYKIIPIIIILISTLIIGTKTPIISFLICIIVYALKYLITFVKDKNYKKLISFIIITCIIIISLIFLIPKTYFYKNLIIHYKFLNLNKISDLLNIKTLDHFLFGSRLSFFKKAYNIYLNSDILNKIIGIGYLNPKKMIEMDLFDILFRNGVFMILFIIYPICIFLRNNTIKNYLSILLAVIISLVAGHVLNAPSVSFILVLTIMSGGKKNEKSVSNNSSI